MGRLAGKAALITGAAVGIGRAATLLFAREGAAVAVLDIDGPGGEATAAAARAAGGRAVFVETDLTDPASVERAVARARVELGRLDILYNNAGGSTARDAPVTETPIEEFWRAIRLDLFGTFLVCKYGIPHLMEAGGGSVVNTASYVAHHAMRPGRDAYAAAKGGVVSLTRSIAVNYAEHRVRANVIAPGGVLTERIERELARASLGKGATQKHLLGLARPEDIAETALFLASDASRQISGQMIPVDGAGSAW